MSLKDIKLMELLSQLQTNKITEAELIIFAATALKSSKKIERDTFFQGLNFNDYNQACATLAFYTYTHLKAGGLEINEWETSGLQTFTFLSKQEIDLSDKFLADQVDFLATKEELYTEHGAGNDVSLGVLGLLSVDKFDTSNPMIEDMLQASIIEAEVNDPKAFAPFDVLILLAPDIINKDKFTIDEIKNISQRLAKCQIYAPDHPEVEKLVSAFEEKCKENDPNSVRDIGWGRMMAGLSLTNNPDQEVAQKASEVMRVGQNMVMFKNLERGNYFDLMKQNIVDQGVVDGAENMDPLELLGKFIDTNLGNKSGGFANSMVKLGENWGYQPKPLTPPQ